MDETQNPLPDGAPEVPSLVIWGRFLLHHLMQEKSVIRDAPGDFALAVLALSVPIWFGMHWYIGDQYSTEIENLNSANEKLDATTKSLQATIEFQDRKLASLTTSKLSDSDTRISRLQYVSVLRRTPYFPVAIDVTFVNTGDAASIGAQFFGKAIVSEAKLSEEELDKYFGDLERAIKRSDSTLEHQPKDVIFHTIVADNITIEMANTAMAGKAFLYIFAGQRYRDDNTPPGKHRITEVCLIGHTGDADAFCEYHNRIFLSD
jgi:hypothetical protein